MFTVIFKPINIFKLYTKVEHVSFNILLEKTRIFCYLFNIINGYKC